MNRSRCTDPGALLLRALLASAAAAGCDASVTALTTCPWASATFVGARHVVVLDIVASLDRYRWLAMLGETELALRGHVALPPAILVADETSVALEIVTLEDH